MAKKFNRSRPQKRNIDHRKLEKYREEIARELGLDQTGAGQKEAGQSRPVSPRGTFNLDKDRPLT